MTKTMYYQSAFSSVLAWLNAVESAMQCEAIYFIFDIIGYGIHLHMIRIVFSELQIYAFFRNA